MSQAERRALCAELVFALRFLVLSFAAAAVITVSVAAVGR